MDPLPRYTENEWWAMQGPDYWWEAFRMRSYAADFETTTDKDDCRVWCWAAEPIEEGEPAIGIDIDGFLSWCHDNANCQVYFHNLAFDGAFLMDYLLNNGWTWAADNRHMRKGSFATLINDMNQIYCITLNFGPAAKVRIFDSMKVIPLSVKVMAESYGLSIGKGSIDYTKERPVGYQPTEEEWEYVRTDVRIVAQVLKVFFEEGLTRMTAGSNALHDYMDRFGGSRAFRKVFPVLDVEQDRFLRMSYKGGFTYADPRFACKEIGKGLVLDVNSMYPWVMHDCELPIGEPKWFDGEPPKSTMYRLWVASVTLRFTVKKDHIPCIQIKGFMRFVPTEYLMDSGMEVTLTVTSVDWDLIRRQYDVEVISWGGGYAFLSSSAQFKGYVDYWMKRKVEATVERNPGKRQVAKLMLNSLYGKFATRLVMRSRMPVIQDDVLKYVDLEPEMREPVYLPVGTFITAYARNKTVSSAQNVYDRFLYADTDSLHIMGTDMPEGLEIDSTALGAWKVESLFTRAKFLRAKTYIEEIDGALNVHVAGLPESCHKHVTFENFEPGATYGGKLYTKRVKGGIVLEEGDMQIRES